jgi:hypothetical protein
MNGCSHFHLNGFTQIELSVDISFFELQYICNTYFKVST